MYFARNVDQELLNWSRESGRKPLLLRGARQVGKSSAVRAFGKSFEHYLELNFEQHRSLHQVFQGDLDPQQICESLSLFFGIPVIPGRTLVFFDEIQACPEAISSLRFFYEKYPALHLIAAGSLLEFALEALPSFGVGRVRSLFMYPCSFDEFLQAQGQDALLRAKSAASIHKPLAGPIHEKLLTLLKRFLILGGMPEMVSAYLQTGDLGRCMPLMDDLISSLRADFAKYRARVPFLRIAEIFDSVVLQAGAKFKYANAASESNHKQIKEALDLLIMAGLVIPVTHTHANGLPLGAEIDPRKRKMLLLDTGIALRLSGLNPSELMLATDFDLVNKGALAEQFAGLEILKNSSAYQQQSLYYWHREARNSNAELDYVMQKGQEIAGLEIKSGTKGTMQSLHLFLAEKKQARGFRFSQENYGAQDAIDVYPLYALGDFVRS